LAGLCLHVFEPNTLHIPIYSPVHLPANLPDYKMAMCTTIVAIREKNIKHLYYGAPVKMFFRTAGKCVLFIFVTIDMFCRYMELFK